MASRSEKRQQRAEKRKKRNTIIIGVIMVGLMIVSILGFSQNSNTAGSNKFSYGGFDFTAVQTDNGGIIFVAEQAGTEVGYFYFQPLDTESISVPEGLATHLYQRKPVVLTLNPLAENEVDINRIYLDRLRQDLQTTAGINVIPATTSDDIMATGEAVYDCTDASEELPVIKYVKDETATPSITEAADNCYELKANGLEIFKIRDKLLYVALGVQAK